MACSLVLPSDSLLWKMKKWDTFNILMWELPGPGRWQPGWAGANVFGLRTSVTRWNCHKWRNELTNIRTLKTAPRWRKSSQKPGLIHFSPITSCNSGFSCDVHRSQRAEERHSLFLTAQWGQPMWNQLPSPVFFFLVYHIEYIKLL